MKRTFIRKDYNRDWSTVFRLDPTSPSGISRKDSRTQITGYKLYQTNGTGQGWFVKVKGETYGVHRIIWRMVHGIFDNSLVVDHLNGNAFDNNISNLCLKTQQGNNQNRAIHSNNSTGYTGVYVDVKAEGVSYFCAQWPTSVGKKGSKRFRIETYGHDQAKALAVAYRSEQIMLLNEQGEQYTARHMAGGLVSDTAA